MRLNSIFLDIDGVLGDFESQLFRLYGLKVELSHELKSWDGHDLILSKHLGYKVTTNDLYEKINQAGQDFWSTIPLLPWAQDLYQLCKQTNLDIILMSSPGSPAFQGAASGKIEWILREFPDINGYSITPNKEHFARKNALLIDDNPKWCTAFKNRGGKVFCFPRSWNDPNWKPQNPLRDLETFLDQLDLSS